MMEDLKISYSNSVINACGNISDFMYGADLLDASQMIKTKVGLSFIDVNHLADRVNMKYFFEQSQLLQKQEEVSIEEDTTEDFMNCE